MLNRTLKWLNISNRPSICGVPPGDRYYMAGFGLIIIVFLMVMSKESGCYWVGGVNTRETATWPGSEMGFADHPHVRARIYIRQKSTPGTPQMGANLCRQCAYTMRNELENNKQWKERLPKVALLVGKYLASEPNLVYKFRENMTQLTTVQCMETLEPCGLQRVGMSLSKLINLPSNTVFLNE